MIIPSIDLMQGNAVQLIGGQEMSINAGDPLPIARKFSLAGEIAVIDLDQALGQGSNQKVVEQLVGLYPCRVGGGIRDLDKARHWLDLGASSIILGTMATPEILKQLPRDRTIAALDARHGEVVVNGWTTRTGKSIEECIQELREYVGAFMITFVEREGRMQGIDLKMVEHFSKLVGDSKLTVAGGVTTVEEIAAIDALGVDAQVGMALYSGSLAFADAIVAPLLARPSTESGSQLWPTVVANESGQALGLCWSDQESIRKAVELMQGVYHSRKRGLWIKGLTSGATQTLRSISLDCDRDTILFKVEQSGNGFCHLDTDSCWGELTGLAHLEKTIRRRIAEAPPGSYTRRLVDSPDLLNAKILEEARELTEAIDKRELVWEAADLFYFALVKLGQAGISLHEVEEELDKRALKITRRPGNAKIQI